MIELEETAAAEEFIDIEWEAMTGSGVFEVDPGLAVDPVPLEEDGGDAEDDGDAEDKGDAEDDRDAEDTGSVGNRRGFQYA